MMGRLLSKRSYLSLACSVKGLILALLFLFSSYSFAIGLSSLTVNSSVGERFYGLLTITGAEGIPANEIFVSLAPRSVYRTMGVEWEYFHTQLIFDVLVDEHKQYTLRVVSTEVAFEPYLDFVVLLRSPAGSVSKQLTVLLDMPALVKPPAAESVQKDKPLNKIQRVTALPPVAADQPKAPIIQPVDKPINKQVEFTEEPDATQAKPTVANSSAIDRGDKSQGATNNWSHMSRSGDSLWAIARRVQAKAGGNIKPIVDALYKNNPNAFIKNNANRLKINARLSVSDAQIKAVINSSAAVFDKPETDLLDTPANTAFRSESSLAAKPMASNELGVLSLVTDDDRSVAVTAETVELSERSSKLADSFDKGLAESKARKLSVENRIDKLYEKYSTLADKTKQLTVLEQALNQSLAETSSFNSVLAEPLAVPASVEGLTSDQATNTTSPNATVNRKPLLLVITAGVALLVLLVVLLKLVQNRRRAAAVDSWELMSSVDNTSAVLDSDDAAVFDDLAAEEIVNRVEVDNGVDVHNALEEASIPAEGAVELEAAVYIAYERYDEAEDLLEQALEFEPDNEALQLQLLEVYAAKRKLKHFDLLAHQLSDLNNDKITLKINYLRSNL